MLPFIDGQVILPGLGDMLFHREVGFLLVMVFQRPQDASMKRVVLGKPAQSRFSGHQNAAP
jgi:hypothetical protein